jgi:hypothetical protein
VTSAAGFGLDLTEMTAATYLTVADVTVVGATAADLTAIMAADNDWYMLLIDSSARTVIEAAAAWTEATYKIFQAQTSDTAVATSAIDDIGTYLKGLSYARTSLWFNQNLTGDLAVAISASRSTAIPGSDTWALKTLSGVVPSDRLTATQVSKLKLKNVNYYQTVGNEGRTFLGQVVGGEYIDTIRFIDWLRATMQVNIYNALISYEKVPNSNEGISIIQGAVEITLQQAVKCGGFKPGSTSSSVPDESDPTAFDPVTRALTQVKFKGILANAIHSVEVTGQVTN